MEIKTVGIACDHAGYPLKQYVMQYLEEKGYPVKDFGTNSTISVDYPDYAHPLAEAIESGEVYPGIAICGSGEGMAITLNKHQGLEQGYRGAHSSAQRCQCHRTARTLRRQQDCRQDARCLLQRHLRGRTSPASCREDCN